MLKETGAASVADLIPTVAPHEALFCEPFLLFISCTAGHQFEQALLSRFGCRRFRMRSSRTPPAVSLRHKQPACRLTTGAHARSCYAGKEQRSNMKKKLILVHNLGYTLS
jgi:hypothetical protein